jgi:hypothetical protein
MLGITELRREALPILLLTSPPLTTRTEFDLQQEMTRAFNVSDPT